MDVFKTPGAFSWSELMTTDPKAAVAFYGQLFGWKSEDMDMGTGAYHVQKVGDAAVGGIMGMPPGSPAGMPPVWGTYVTVANVDETVALAEKLGGKVCMPIMHVPGVGRMAVIADPQGAVLSVITYDAAG
jgi:predicted enzyme related to lactoylglutathione lyase